MRTMKKIRHTIAILILALFLAACGNTESETEGESADSTEASDTSQVVNYVTVQEIATLDSVMIPDTNTSSYVAHIQEGLYWEDENNEIQPALAEDMPEISEDGLTYTIQLREDAEWENGDPVTADDFVFAVERLVDPAVGASFSYLAESIVNANEIIAGERPVEELGVNALDTYTLEIELVHPTPYFLNILAFSPMYPQHHAFVIEEGEDYGTNSDTFLASGPYTVENWNPTAQSWTFQKNENYYNADEIAVDTIEVHVIKEGSTNVNLYEAGDVDNAILQGEVAREYADHPDFVQTEKAGTMYVYFNFEHEYFQNENLREAMDYAINNDELAEAVLGDGSQPLVSFVPRNFISHPDTEEDFVDDVGLTDKYDEAQANALWEEAQSELGVEEIDINLLASDADGVRIVTEYIQGEIQSALPGVNITIQNVPTKNRIELSRAGDFDLLVAGWVADYADGLNFLQVLQSDSNYNYSQYSNEEYDAYYEAAQTEHAGNPEERYQSMLDAQHVLTEDSAYVPLYQNVDAQLRSPRIKGLTLRSVGNEFDFRTAYIEE